MTDLSRRAFLGGALALTAAVAVPIPAFARETLALPVVYGDGVHDDTAGLQALFDGKPVIMQGERVQIDRAIGRVEFNGTFRTSATIHIGPQSVEVDAGRLRLVALSKGDYPAIHLHKGAPRLSCEGLYIEGYWCALYTDTDIHVDQLTMLDCSPGGLDRYWEGRTA